ncbi:MAG: hypothetical protein COA71_14510 [SAR86 cluster bacterium]|uniref:DNA-directed DNA polymerase n=1 Tax=SAR86 cluster bacterium TaxID=2030880 RepID=A0A2A5C5Z0_9GAMM|nr:MAG: hypothetical protein COA71_14510 [SAR86 cluster bacterium]
MNNEPERILLIDFETQARVAIQNPLYTNDLDTCILCMSWGFQGGEGYLWWPGDPVPQEIVYHIEAGGLIGASNATFDREIWENVAIVDHDFPCTDLKQWICTQAQARVAGLPSSLDNSAKALKLTERKTASGHVLINKCCIPPFSTDPNDYANLGAYCLQDWVVMNKVAQSVPRLSKTAMMDYLINERINTRGIKIDMPLVKAARKYADAERESINKRISLLTDEVITKHTQYKRLSAYLVKCFEEVKNYDAINLMVRYKKNEDTGETEKKYSTDQAARDSLLNAYEDESIYFEDEILELLNLMNDAGGTATSKFAKMEQKADPDDHRVRNVLRYAGAPSTLRFSSIGLQVHNFRRDAFSFNKAEFIRKQMLAGEELHDVGGTKMNVMDTLGRLLRSAIIPEEGNIFIVGDWKSVESRITAYLAGDTDKLDVFRKGEDPYCYAAEAIYGRPINEKDGPKERAVGKVADLACGFLGGKNALMKMAANKKVPMSPEQAKEIVSAYRIKHHKIVELGNRLELAAKKAVKNPGTSHRVNNINYYFNENDRALYCTLPDGETRLRYPECRIEMKPVSWSKSEKAPQLTALKAAIKPKATAKEWTRHSLWRGLLLENIVQAIGAIMLRDCLYECQEEGLHAIFHVHDEIILEEPENEAEEKLVLLQEIMETAPDWLEGLPLVAEPKLMKRYGK